VNSLFQVRNAQVRYGRSLILKGIDLELASGSFVAIVGPNGAGKSTLISLLSGLVKPSEGWCRYRGHDAHKWNRKEYARRVAVVTQADAASFPFTAEQVIAMGRMPYASGIFESPNDLAAVERALEMTDTGHLRAREFRTLSGGEKQRTLLAAALAQSPETLLLDEPSNHLDLQHQVSLYNLLRRLSGAGTLVVAVTHDVNLAALHADRIVMMEGGTILSDGTPGEVLRAEVLERLFHINVELHHTSSGRPWMVYGA
jgi:iron complex transport system ATP-binding protein